MPVSPALDTSEVRCFFLFDILSAGKAMVNSKTIESKEAGKLINQLNEWLKHENSVTIINIETLPPTYHHGYTTYRICVWYHQ